ncbi:hypothetical protein ABE438_17490 [Bosea sp. TWI1241]|uniref:hypothetical protein n=1 Tax=Bosea sp. TWI1241 TaxID=3148904 RepID=UPI003209B7C3
MNRDQLIRSLRRYARNRSIRFEVDTKKGSGSHYRVRLGDKVSTLQNDLNPGRIERFLKQLGVNLADL